MRAQKFERQMETGMEMDMQMEIEVEVERERNSQSSEFESQFVKYEISADYRCIVACRSVPKFESRKLWLHAYQTHIEWTL